MQTCFRLAAESTTLRANNTNHLQQYFPNRENHVAPQTILAWYARRACLRRRWAGICRRAPSASVVGHLYLLCQRQPWRAALLQSIPQAAVGVYLYLAVSMCCLAVLRCIQPSARCGWADISSGVSMCPDMYSVGAPAPVVVVVAAAYIESVDRCLHRRLHGHRQVTALGLAGTRCPRRIHGHHWHTGRRVLMT